MQGTRVPLKKKKLHHAEKEVKVVELCLHTDTVINNKISASMSMCGVCVVYLSLFMVIIVGVYLENKRGVSIHICRTNILH